jgi:hypothetical protein
MKERHRLHRIDEYVINAERGLTDWKVGRYWVIEFQPEPGDGVREPTATLADSGRGSNQDGSRTRPASVIR